MNKTIFKNPFLRKQKVTTVNLENYQVEIMKIKKINCSQLIRILLDDFLFREWPELFKELKEREK